MFNTCEADVDGRGIAMNNDAKDVLQDEKVYWNGLEDDFFLLVVYEEKILTRMAQLRWCSTIKDRNVSLKKINYVLKYVLYMYNAI